MYSIYEDLSNNIWVGTETSLHRYNKDEDKFARVKLRNLGDNSQLDTTKIQKILQDLKGNYWLINGEGNFHIISNNLAPDTALKETVKRQLLAPDLKIYDIKVWD